MNTIRQLVLAKEDHRFLFRYWVGDEARVVDALAGLAGDSDSAFDWFDAAILSYQMGRHLQSEFEGMPFQAPGRS